MEEASKALFYFCDLYGKECPKMDKCKRWLAIKDMKYDEYKNLGVAKLYNLCFPDESFRMFMEDKDNG